jgi:DNA repair exonuclease SbcCD ATPase subunit
MGLLDRLRNSFKKEEVVEEVDLSLEEIISRVDKKFEEKESEVTGKSYEKVRLITDELDSLSGLIAELEKLDPEGVMQAPKAVKERFCSYSKNQIESIKKPSKDIEEIRAFLNKTYTIVHNLGGLTQKQIMHIEFFFKEDFRPIIKRSREISDMINEAREIIRTGNLDPYRKIKELHENMRGFDRVKIEKNNKITVIKNGIERLKAENKKLSEEIGKIDTGDFQQCSSEIEEAEKKLSNIEQDLSSFLSIEKLLKKLVHEKEIKNKLLDLYTESPAKALLQDKELELVGFVKEALELHKKGSIDVDEKKIEKAAKIIGNTNYIKEQREKLLSAINELDKKQVYMQDVISPKIERKKKMEEEKERIQSDMKRLEENLEKLPKEIEEVEEKKTALKEDIAAKASEIMNAKVRLKNTI